MGKKAADLLSLPSCYNKIYFAVTHSIFPLKSRGLSPPPPKKKTHREFLKPWQMFNYRGTSRHYFEKLKHRTTVSDNQMAKVSAVQVAKQKLC